MEIWARETIWNLEKWITIEYLLAIIIGIHILLLIFNPKFYLINYDQDCSYALNPLYSIKFHWGGLKRDILFNDSMLIKERW